MDERIDRQRGEGRASKAELAHAIETLVPFAERRGLKDASGTLRSLEEKLVTNRFHFAVLGQMKRGKSSVVNALLGADVLPTGILPLTSVITRVRFGSKPGARIFYQSGMAEETGPERLCEYITEEKNPGNRKQVASAELQWPSPLLQMGMDLVDTPGIGSTRAHNTATTENYLREIDAGIMVLSVDPPITEAEAEFLKMLRYEVPRLLFVVNKTDVATADEVEAVVDFLRGELTGRCGMDDPEIYPVSARYALGDIPVEESLERNSGIEKIAERLRYFAAEEKEQALLESVAQDVLRIAATLRFAAGIGERACRLSGEELAARRQELERAIASTEQGLNDIRHLLRKDAALVVERIAKDLKAHIDAARPAVRERMEALQGKHRRETREKLGALLDGFVEGEIRRIYEQWRMREEERIRGELSGLSERLVERANEILAVLQQAAGALFEVPVTPVSVRATLAVESRLSYFTEPTFKFLQEKLVFALPGGLQRRIVFRRMRSEMELEMRRNAGRIRYDYLERVEKALARFEKEIGEAVAMVVDSLWMALEPKEDARDGLAAERKAMDSAVACCEAIVAGQNVAGIEDGQRRNRGFSEVLKTG